MKNSSQVLFLFNRWRRIKKEKNQYYTTHDEKNDPETRSDPVMGKGNKEKIV
jgi:hypothetical protein